jgi:hypothetical protein
MGDVVSETLSFAVGVAMEACVMPIRGDWLKARRIPTGAQMVPNRLTLSGSHINRWQPYKGCDNADTR